MCITLRKRPVYEYRGRTFIDSVSTQSFEGIYYASYRTLFFPGSCSLPSHKYHFLFTFILIVILVRLLDGPDLFLQTLTFNNLMHHQSFTSENFFLEMDSTSTSCSSSTSNAMQTTPTSLTSCFQQPIMEPNDSVGELSSRLGWIILEHETSCGKKTDGQDSGLRHPRRRHTVDNLSDLRKQELAEIGSQLRLISLEFENKVADRRRKSSPN